MGQAFLSGADPAKALESVTPADIIGIREGAQRYGLLLNDAGGIKDDFMTTRLAGESALYLVVNAVDEGQRLRLYRRAAERRRANLSPAPERALLALQGPAAAECWSGIRPASPNSPSCARRAPPSRARPPSSAAPAIPAKTVSRFRWRAKTPNASPAPCWAKPKCMPIGLGARDSLRLEAGLCLYGHDIDESTDPVEANLVWSIGKRRKMERGFAGADLVMDRLFNGAARKRVGIKPEGRAPAREGTEIAVGGQVIGKVTSGGFGPSLNGPLAMGYVQSEFSTDGTKLELLVRGKALAAEVVPMPFVPHRYNAGDKSES